MLHDQNVHKTDDAGANKSNTAMQSLDARTGQQNGGGERHGQVGLQKRKSDGKKKKIDAVTLRTEVDLHAQKLRQSGKKSGSVIS